MERESMSTDYTTVLDQRVSFKSIAFLCFIAVAAFYINTKNHLLFHSGLEMFNIMIAFCISIIAAISRRIYNKKHFMLFGVVFAIIGIMDVLHTLAYPGIEIFNGYNSTNLSVQLFVAARYIESTSLLTACLLYGKRVRFWEFLTVYFTVLVILLFTIFKYDLFPDCYIEGIGYTLFKMVSDFITAVVLVLNIFVMYKRKDQFQKNVLTYLTLSFLAAVLAELSFAICPDLNDFPHVLGSILRFISYYFVYKALVENSIMSPHRRIKNMNAELEENNKRLKEINEALQNEINERVKIEKAMIESEDRYRTFVEFIPDAVLISDDDKMIYANKAAEWLVGAKDKSEILKKHRLDFVHPDYVELVKQRMEKSKNERVVVPLSEQKLLRLDGTCVDVEATGVCMAYEDHDTYISVMRDVSERHRAERLQRDIEENKRLLQEAEKYDRLKNEFMANVSHELRTPLNIIFSDIQLMELYMSENNTDGYDDNISRHFRIMKQNCYRLLRLVNNIIDISKMDSGFYELQLKNCDIVSLVEDVTMSAVPFAENKGIDLVFDTDMEEQVIAVDPDKIERVVLNLLSNAVKFTNPGSSIWVSIKNINGNVYIIVKDNGVGIPRDKLQVVFDRFVQLGSSLSRENEGSGIGLSLVKSIVEAHGGRIMVKSEVNVGSEFVVEIPSHVLSDDDETPADFLREPNTNKINIEFSDI